MQLVNLPNSNAANLLRNKITKLKCSKNNVLQYTMNKFVIAVHLLQVAAALSHRSHVGICKT